MKFAVKFKVGKDVGYIIPSNTNSIIKPKNPFSLVRGRNMEAVFIYDEADEAEHFAQSAVFFFDTYKGETLTYEVVSC